MRFSVPHAQSRRGLAMNSFTVINEQPRQFTYAKRYATALASRRPLGQRGFPPRNVTVSQ